MKLFHINELEENQSKGFTVNNTSIFAVKRDNQIYLYSNDCPHLGITLEFQADKFLDLDNHFIECSNHGALFEVENGECISGPCLGQNLEPYPFEIRDGYVEVAD